MLYSIKNCQNKLINIDIKQYVNEERTKKFWNRKKSGSVELYTILFLDLTPNKIYSTHDNPKMKKA